MKTYRVGIILSATYVVEAEDEEEAEELAKDLAEKEYLDLNVEETNFVEEEKSDDDTQDEDTSEEEENDNN